MKTKKGFTKTDLIVILCCVGFLLASLGAVGNAGREKAKETVCLSNLGQWGKMFQMWLNDHNGTFMPGTDKWFYSLAPYYGAPYRTDEVRRECKLRFCPMAVQFSDEGAQQPSCAWKQTSLIGSPEQWTPYYWDGSYGSNSWMYSSVYKVAGIDVAWKTANVKNTNTIPLLIDSASFGGRPQETDTPPQISGDMVGGNQVGAFMKQFCIDRHNGAVNAVFMDFSTRSVGLKELYTLKWHRAYNTCNKWTLCGNGGHSPAWPEWMSSFKDF